MRVYLLMGLMDSYNVLIKMVDSGGELLLRGKWPLWSLVFIL